MFTTIGSAADYGRFGRWLLLAVTAVCWASQFAGLALTRPGRWGAAMALYMAGFVSYGATLVFYAAAFPRLARNTAHARALRARYDAGEIPREVYEVEESMEKNRISNISTVRRPCSPRDVERRRWLKAWRRCTATLGTLRRCA